MTVINEYFCKYVSTWNKFVDIFELLENKNSLNKTKIALKYLWAYSFWTINNPEVKSRENILRLRWYSTFYEWVENPSPHKKTLHCYSSFFNICFFPFYAQNLEVDYPLELERSEVSSSSGLLFSFGHMV